MNWMIVAMLKLSRLDAGMVALKKEPFPVNRMLTEANRSSGNFCGTERRKKSAFAAWKASGADGWADLD